MQHNPSTIRNCLHDAWGRMEDCERNHFIAHMSEGLRHDIAAANGETKAKFDGAAMPTTNDTGWPKAIREFWSQASPFDRLQFAIDTADYRLHLITDALGEFTSEEGNT